MSGIMYGGRRLCTVFFRFTPVSSKSSVNIAVASWFTTVVSKVWWFIRVAFKRNYVRRKTSRYYFFFLVLGGLFHRKAALTFLLRADLEQWSVNYGDLYVGFLNGNPFSVFVTNTSITPVDVYKWDSLSIVDLYGFGILISPYNLKCLVRCGCE